LELQQLKNYLKKFDDGYDSDRFAGPWVDTTLEQEYEEELLIELNLDGSDRISLGGKGVGEAIVVDDSDILNEFASKGMNMNEKPAPELESTVPRDVVMHMTVARLKEECRKKGLAVYRNKSALQERLMNPSAPKEMKRRKQNCNGVVVVIIIDRA